MKIWILLMMAMFLAAGAPARANQLACSNADQRLSYTHFTSNGGALMDIEELTYQGQKQVNRNYQGPAIDWKLSEERVISQEVSNNVTLISSAALATGQLNGQAFAEWVICKKAIAPQCPMCP